MNFASLNKWWENIVIKGGHRSFGKEWNRYWIDISIFQNLSHTHSLLPFLSLFYPFSHSLPHTV